MALPKNRAQDDPLRRKYPLFLFFLIKLLHIGVTLDLWKSTKDGRKSIQHGGTFGYFTLILGFYDPVAPHSGVH